MSSNYPFTMYEDEGICDLFDIKVPDPITSLLAENEEMFDDDDLITEDTSVEMFC